MEKSKDKSVLTRRRVVQGAGALAAGVAAPALIGVRSAFAAYPERTVRFIVANTPGGPLTGFEANLQLPFSFLPGIWSNFGLLANVTHVKSTINYITRTATATLPQLSINANLVGKLAKANTAPA